MSEATGSTRRDFLKALARNSALGGLAVGTAYLSIKPGTSACAGSGDCASCSLLSGCTLDRAAANSVWQIDPEKCVHCGKCATNCVLNPSAVKCVHAFPMCGFCELCTGYFMPQPNSLGTGAENQLCPTGAIQRHFIEDPYYEYTIDEPLCIGCGKCVKGCGTFGNGSLYLQVRHDRCLNCNECAIAKACPAKAYVRVPASKPYLFKDKLLGKVTG